MTQIEQCDILVLGSGESGKYLAWTTAKAGRHAVVIERALIGGSCPNVACLPSKNIIYSAHLAALFRRAHEFGISAGEISVDMNGVRNRKRKMVDDLVEIHRKNYTSSGAELVMGEGRFVAPTTIEVNLRDGGTKVFNGERVYLNVGTRAAIPDIPGLQQSRPLTHVEALELDNVPDHLIVLGGGDVGLEFAQPMRRFGSRVTMVERASQLAGREDSDVAKALMQRFSEEGIDVELDARPIKVEGHCGDKLSFHVATPSGTRVIKGSDILVAAGRMANTQGIGLDTAGIELDARGYVKVNERLETTAKGVWAMGDCAASPQFTHVAFDDFRIIRDNLNGGQRSTAGRIVPYCMFTDPELGRGRPERSRGTPRRRAVSCGQGRDGSGVANTHAVGDARLSQGAHRHRQRSHTRFCRLGRGRRRTDRRRANGDACGAPVHDTARQHPDAPDDRRRLDGAFCKRTCFA